MQMKIQLRKLTVKQLLGSTLINKQTRLIRRRKKLKSSSRILERLTLSSLIQRRKHGMMMELILKKSIKEEWE